jgi:cytochrome c-type biogenesis protein
MSGLASLRLGFAFSAGVATFFAPCAYPLLPGYVAFYLGDAASDASAGVRLRRAGVVAALISGGMLVVYAALAVVVVLVGTRPLSNLVVLELVVGAGLAILGGAVAAGRYSVAAVHVRLPARRRSKSGFLLFGVVYAAAAAGCTAPLFVGLAGVALGAGPAGAIAVFAAYTTGMVLSMTGVTGATALGYDRFLSRFAGGGDRFERLAGALLALAGLAQLYRFLFRYGGLSLLGLA